MGKKTENAMNLYLEGIRDGNYVEAVNKYTGARYTQHSTGVRDGKEGFIEFFGDFVQRCPVRDIQIVRKIEDGKNVFLQAFQDINNGDTLWVTTDFFDTDEDDRIIEHWDVIAPFCDRTPSGNSSVDGPAEIRDRDKTEENKSLIRRLFDEVLLSDGKHDSLDHFISRDKIVTHSSVLEKGFDGLTALAGRSGSQFDYKENVLLMGEGNFVAALSRVLSKERKSEQELCRADIFRIENGLVVEHWDNSEPVPEVNVNSGKF